MRPVSIWDIGSAPRGDCVCMREADGLLRFLQYSFKVRTEQNVELEISVDHRAEQEQVHI